MKRLFKKVAGDFSDANIPNPMIEVELSTQGAVALYWRELAENNKTIEIWSTRETTFAIIEGDFSDGEWGQGDVTTISEHDKLADALAEARTTYVFKDGGEGSEPQEQLADNSSARLLKKNK